MNIGIMNRFPSLAIKYFFFFSKKGGTLVLLSDDIAKIKGSMSGGLDSGQYPLDTNLSNDDLLRQNSCALCLMNFLLIGMTGIKAVFHSGTWQLALEGFV